MLIEINMGHPDFRVRKPLPFQLSLKTFSKAIANVPFDASVGIGGEPLRLEDWKEYLGIILERFNEVTVVSSPQYLNDSCLSYLLEKNIFVVIEVNCYNELEILTTLLSRYPTLGFSCYTSGINLTNASLSDKAASLGIKLSYENYIPLDRGELSKFIQALSQRGLPTRTTYTCGIVNGKVLGLNGDGTVLPCVTMQFPETIMGNLLTDSLDKITEQLSFFRDKLTCSMCCQSRSFALYSTFDRDPLCSRNYTSFGDIR